MSTRLRWASQMENASVAESMKLRSLSSLSRRSISALFLSVMSRNIAAMEPRATRKAVTEKAP
jgi:hypothetical protein